uniref:Secreted protein n=1 Tax=Rhizophora mucronata TaxID=61149 RepID=A0A2P2NUS7_RHIMU
MTSRRGTLQFPRFLVSCLLCGTTTKAQTSKYAHRGCVRRPNRRKQWQR